jgi:Zn-dependent protease
MNVSIHEGLIIFLILVGSISIHEWAHAYAADKLGDTLPRSQGRVTLNPIAHIDPIGTVVLPLVVIFGVLPFFIIGWGKPVQVDPRNHRHPVRDDLIITIAGPLSNLAIALAAALGGGILLLFVPAAVDIVVRTIQLNCVLFLFNMIPIPPLDGSHFLRHAIRMRDELYHQLTAWGFVIIIILINIPGFRALFGTLLSLIALPFYLILRVFL